MKKLFLAPILLISGMFLLSAPHALAVEYQSPRTLALGGAGRGGPLLNDSIFLNPAYASFSQTYSISGGYTWFDHLRNYNVSVQDARAELLQAGVSYTKREQNAAFNIGASRMVVQRLGFGLGSKVILDNETNKMTSDFIFSSAFIALPWLYSSLIIDNLLQSSEAKSRNLYRTFFLGLKFNPSKEIEIFVDPLYSPDYVGGNKAGFSAGAELSLLADFYLRFGKFTDGEISYLATRGSGYGFGLGWIGPKINFDYAYTRVTSAHSGLPQSSAHALATTLFF